MTTQADRKIAYLLDIELPEKDCRGTWVVAIFEVRGAVFDIFETKFVNKEACGR